MYSITFTKECLTLFGAWWDQSGFILFLFLCFFFFLFKDLSCFPQFYKQCLITRSNDHKSVLFFGGGDVCVLFLSQMGILSCTWSLDNPIIIDHLEGIFQVKYKLKGSGNIREITFFVVVLSFWWLETNTIYKNRKVLDKFSVVVVNAISINDV